MESVNPVFMFALQAALGIIMLFFGLILNGMRTSIDRVSAELKTLNDAVLGKYVQREESERKWEAQRTLDHDLRGELQKLRVDFERSQVNKP